MKEGHTVHDFYATAAKETLTERAREMDLQAARLRGEANGLNARAKGLREIASAIPGDFSQEACMALLVAIKPDQHNDLDQKVRDLAGQVIDEVA